MADSAKVTPRATKSTKGVKGFFDKIKSIKHIEIIIAVILCATILLIYFSSLTGGTRNTTETSLTFSEYVSKLESKMEKILSKIDGAGSVSVMITFESGVEMVYAYSSDTQTNTTSDGAKETSITVDKNTIVISGGQPLVIKEIMPMINGVIIVSEGAKNPMVKLNLLKAVQALLDVKSSKIEIFPSK